MAKPSLNDPPQYPEKPYLSQAPDSFASQPPLDDAAAGKRYRDQLEAMCARGEHQKKRKFGTCGIITAVCCFPFGFICLYSDSEVRCTRCKEKVG